MAARPAIHAWFPSGSLVELHKSPDVALNGQLAQLISCQDDEVGVCLLDGTRCHVDAAHIRTPDPRNLGSGTANGFDVLLGPQSSGAALGDEIAQCMMEKGFCVVRTCQSGGHETQDLLRQMEVERKLSRLPEEIEEGYLGVGGKGKVVWVDAESPEVVKMNDQNLSYLASLFQPHSEDVLGKSVVERTPALLCLSLGEEGEDEYPFPLVDDGVLGDYLGMWRRRLVRIVQFMGPSVTTVTLENTDVDAVKIPSASDSVTLLAGTNTIVMFRMDCYDYSCTSDGEIVSMMTTLLAPAPTFTLVSWEGSLEDVQLGPPPPSGDTVNVMNVSTRLGMRWDEAEFYGAGLLAGSDAVVEIPLSRFDVNVYWCPEPDDLPRNPNRTTQRHMSFCDGIDFFDHKHFEISLAEARGMGPMQRQVLDVGGNALHMFGITKKDTNRHSHHAGCSVGLDKDDFPTLPNVQMGGQNVIAIIANRFSFVFNLKGPNFVCDTACSASLVATHLAKMLLVERKFDPLEFHVALGCHLCLSPGPFIGTSNGQMSSPSGRCFTFNATANGYLRGEGTSGMLLKYGQLPSEREAIFRGSQTGQDGRSASLTAPNGPAQEMMITRAFREAGITPPESTAWECHGTGTSLGDPIEVGAVRRIQVKYQRTEPLMVSSNKSNIGHLEGGAAMAGMVKAVLQVKYTRCFPTLHLAQLNPHLEHESFDAVFETEAAAFVDRGHCQVSSFGFGGTNGHAVFWGSNIVAVPDVRTQLMKRLSKMLPPEVQPIGSSPDDWESDWPEKDCQAGDRYSVIIGSGNPRQTPVKFVKVSTFDEVDEGAAPYAISGNFNDWKEELMMQGDLPGVNTATVEVPVGGSLQFRFLKDGDPSQVLGPAIPRCTKKSTPILGPDRSLTNTWVVEGTPGQEVQVDLFVKQGVRSMLWIKR